VFDRKFLRTRMFATTASLVVGKANLKAVNQAITWEHDSLDQVKQLSPALDFRIGARQVNEA
jgi:hypothetical protein